MLEVLWIFSLGVEGNVLAEDTLANVDAAIAELHAPGKLYDVILLTGGVFDAQSGQTEPVSRLMKEALGDVGIVSRVLIAGDSNTTRGDVREGLELLATNQISTQDVVLTIVSERLHCLGIRQLLNRYDWAEPIGICPSDFRLNAKAAVGRVVRLLLYRIDPDGTGWMSRRVQANRT